VKGYMTSLAESGQYQLEGKTLEKLQRNFVGYCCDDVRTREVIGEVYRTHDYLIDPHTAVAFDALAQYRRETGDAARAIVVSTASPFKFCDSALEALGEELLLPGLDSLDQLSEKTGMPIPKPLAELRGKAPRFDRVVEKDRMVDAVHEMLQ